MADYFNDVPLGQAGTGAAYILPQSRAVNSFLNDFDRNRQIQQQNELNKQKYAQQLAQAYKDNQLKIAGGLNWQPEIQQRSKDITNMGNELFQAGINPYSYDHSNPLISKQVDDFNMKRQQLLQDVGTRDALQKQLNEDDKLLSLHGPGYFDPEYLQQRQQFLNTPLADISSKGIQLPNLSKAFNYNEFVGKLKATPQETEYYDRNHVKHTIQVPDEAQHRNTILSAIQTDPSATAAYRRAVGIPLDQIATTTDFNKERDFNADYFKNTPEGQKELLDNGITSVTSDKFKKFVDEHTQQTIDAKKRGDRFIQQGVDRLNGEVHKVNKTGDNLDYQRYLLALDNNKLAHTRFAWEQENKAGTDDGRDTFIDDLTQGDTQARSQLIRAANAFGGRFSPSKDGFTITMPHKEQVQLTDDDPASENYGKPIFNEDGSPKYKNVVTDQTFTIPNDGSSASKTTANALLNQLDLFKKRALYDKKSNAFKGGNQTTENSTKTKVSVNTTAPKSIKKSDVAAKAAASGYSVKEYTDLLRQKGIKIE